MLVFKFQGHQGLAATYRDWHDAVRQSAQAWLDLVDAVSRIANTWRARWAALRLVDVAKDLVDDAAKDLASAAAMVRKRDACLETARSKDSYASREIAVQIDLKGESTLRLTKVARCCRAC